MEFVFFHKIILGGIFMKKLVSTGSSAERQKRSPGRTARMNGLLILCAVLIAFTGCGGNSGSNNGGSSSATQTGQTTASASGTTMDKTPVTLKVLWPGSFENPGVQETLVAKEIEKQTGITMDLIVDNNNEEKLKLYVASGDLPDICFANNNSTVKKSLLVQSGLAIPLNKYLESNGKYILDNYQIPLENSNKLINNTDGNYYFLPYNVNPEPYQKLDFRPGSVALNLRWDYYKEMGYPEAKTIDDFLQVMSDMQKKFPKAPNGKKTYAFAGFNDWGTWGYYVTNMYYLGYTEVTNAVFSPDKETIHYRFSPEGPFWDSVELYYKANKLGLFDPDSFTMKYDNYVEKARNGQLLTIGASWIATDANTYIQKDTGTDKGFEPVPFEAFPYSWAHSNTQSKAGYWDNMAFISSSCKTPDRAMDLLNYCRTYEGSRLIHSGIKGTHWDVIDGKPQMIDSFVKETKADPNVNKEAGIELYTVLAGYEGAAIDPNDKSLLALQSTMDLQKKFATPLDNDFSQHYNATFPGEVWDNMVKAGTAKLPVANIYYSAFAPTETDEIKKIHTQCEEYLKKNVSKLILAKSDEEFAKAKDQMIKDMNKYGLEKMDAWYNQQIADSNAAYESLMK